MLKKCPKNFQMSEQNWGCLDKMSEVNFSPAETLESLLDFHQTLQTCLYMQDKYFRQKSKG